MECLRRVCTGYAAAPHRRHAARARDDDHDDRHRHEGPARRRKWSCTQTPGQDKCQSEKKIDLTEKGLNVGYHKETVKSVKAPKNSAVIFGVDGGFMRTSLNSNAEFSVYGGGWRL